VARLSEVSLWSDAVCVEFSFRRGLCVLSKSMTRSGEQGSPKRDGVVQPLLHTRSGEAG